MADSEKMIEKYKAQGYSDYQLEEIRLGLDEGLDVSQYARIDYLAIQMRQIRFGLEEKLDVSWYAGRSFDWFQMEEIRIGLEKGLDVSCYAKEKYSYEVMREIRKGLEDGIELERFAAVGAEFLRELHKAVKDKQNILPYIKAGYDPEQLAEIRHAHNNGCKIDQYLNTSYRGIAIREIWKGLKNGVDVSIYAKPEYSWMQMREIRLGLENRVDVSVYAKVLYSWEQMREIRIGMQNKIDISKYKSMVHSAADMRKIRKSMEQEQIDAEAEYELERKQHDHGIDRISAAQYNEVKQAVESSADTQTVRVVISEDKKKAFMYIESDTVRLTKEAIERELERNGVVAGIDKALIDEIASGGRRGEVVTIAERELPVKGADGYYQFLFDRIKPDEEIDFENISWYTNTHRGQPLAIYHAAEPGKPGHLVDGTEIPASSGKDIPVLKGEGFTLLGDKKTYIAEIDGCVAIRNKSLFVERLLVLSGDNAVTDNIDFNGCIYIKSDVHTRVRIHATGDIVVDGSVSGASLSCLGNIFIRGGVDGDGEAFVTAVGYVIGKYFENVTIEAADIISNYYMKCAIKASDSIKAYSKICGGVVYAGKKIETVDIGNRNGAFTKVTLGNVRQQNVQHKFRQDMEEMDKQIRLLNEALDDMKNRFEPEVLNTMPMFLKLENAIFTKETEKKSLISSMAEVTRQQQQLNNAVLRIKGMMYDGTSVEINDGKLDNVPLSKVELVNRNHSIDVIQHK